MAHKLAMIVVVLLLPLGYVSVAYTVGLWSRIDEHALADDGLHYFEGLNRHGTRGRSQHRLLRQENTAGGGKTRRQHQAAG